MASPRVSWDQTKTMAVQGAAPSKINPAMYWPTFSGPSMSTNSHSKKNQAMANMVNGLISQLTVRVIIKPLGRS